MAILDLRFRLLLAAVVGALVLAASAMAAGQTTSAPPDGRKSNSIIHKVRDSDRLEMTVNTSRILTLDQKIPQIDVNNPEVVSATPLSPNQILLSARKPGVTQVSLWDENHQVHTVDVLVFGDARELSMILATEFPNAALKVRPVSTGVLISGHVDQPDQVSRIIQVAEEYYPKVINNITVGGVQQVLLHIKVMEVSRTKLRTLGFDFADFFSDGSMIASGVAEMAGQVVSGMANSGRSTFQFRIIGGGDSFYGFLEALRQDDLAKILSEPTLVTVSGRPAYFEVGGEIPYEVSQGLGAVSIEWKDYGTRVDFVPIVLGNGRLRLEVRPRVSEVDNTRSATSRAPAIKSREVDTGVELMAGQTLAIAGLVQTRIEAQNRGLPIVSEVPYLGALFRRVREERNEIETLVLVTPELVEAMEPEEVPQCGPGMRTTSPSDCELYLKGFLEVPNPCPPCNNGNGFAGSAGGMNHAVPADATNGEGAAPADQPGALGTAYFQRQAALGARTGPEAVGRPPRPKPSSGSNGTRLPGFGGPIGYDTGTP